MRRVSKWNIAEWFILSQTVLPALLYFPGSQAFRVPIRLASYGISLVVMTFYMVFVRKGFQQSSRAHPAAPYLFVCLAYLSLMILHPTTNSYLSGIAQVGLYFSVMTPLFWASAFVREPAHLKRLLWLLLICNGINAFVGVMQVQDPSVWMPREFSSVITGGTYGLAVLTYQGADGQLVIRPPGLGDSPGGVCGPAVFALYLGLVFAVVDRVWWRKILAAIFGTLGAAAIFLTLVRSSILIAVGMVVAYVLLQGSQGRVGRALALVVIGAAAISVAFLHSTSVGGETIVSRFHTILEENPKDFYNKNRGIQIAAGFNELLPKYPLGAGLGRWGMMSYYFGDAQNRESTPIGVETQPPVWIVDGGIVVLLGYTLAVFIALLHAWRMSKTGREPRGRALAGMILAVNIGMAAHCLSYPVFCSPIGMQFWFLAGALQGVMGKLPRKPMKPGRLPFTPYSPSLPRPSPQAV